MTGTPSSPRVSVVMPAYNAERFIAAAVASVFAQTEPDWELVIVDDGSTDGTVAALQPFLEDPRVRLYTDPHRGVDGAVRNAGLGRAGGRYIAFLDADDEYTPDALALRADYLDAHPEATAVFGFFTNIGEAGEALPTRYPFLNEGPDGTVRVRPDFSPRWQDLHAGDFPSYLQGLMLRRETLARVGDFAEDVLVSSDHLFFSELLLDNFEGLHWLPRFVFRYRQVPASLSRNAERFARVLKSYPVLLGRIARDERYARHGLREGNFSPLFARWLRNDALGRINSGRPQEARALLAYALREPLIRPADWLRVCLPCWLRSHLPEALVDTLRTWRPSLPDLNPPPDLTTGYTRP